ncbi:MAG: Penicillin-binding protein, 1A family [Candidatus Nomurabacteria bacterium GW2011_GWA2_40_9]|uniref:Penicillin-binding protein, 1A family n=1 Tax=Candidatus Nomurabacteria bacterium GW2011_GWA2_40_9 TaxID=1618734 RepID=A0A0G0TY57_9BACT|nr:MAG: Penicillin-binding protein, 1A family [Candidatus Nomurabacteria bacterium GW2011_GWA2_40_9]
MIKKKLKITEKNLKKIKLTKHILYFLAGAFLFFFALGIIWVATLKAPDYNSFVERKIINSTKIYDRTGEVLLYDIHQDERRTNIPFESMGVNIKNATVAIEDAEFYNHSGVRIRSTVRAVLSNIFHVGIGGGGSTITQQLVKNTLLNSKKSLVRKVKEWVLAVKIDASMSKEKILELYLNEVPYGGTVYGIEEASKTYFDKHASELSIAESAYLAGIPQSPSYLSPYGKHTDKLEDRKNLVLYKMQELNFITKEEYDLAKSEPVAFLPQELKGLKAPHFVFFIKDYLEEKYGIDIVEKGGLKVTTTLDYNLQEKGEEITKEEALKNEKDWNGKNASLVAIDPKTGQILTMIGSRDYFDKTIDGNFNVATAKRQPGSSFKPFIYATAFNKGFTPDTVLFDLPTEFQTTCNAYGKAMTGSQSDCYMPQNYDGKTVGPISLRNALAQSRNIPAVKLFYLAGMRDSLKTAEDMGISTLSDISRYGLTLVIGGGEVTLLDITSAYGVFANDGIKNNYTSILKVEDAEGNILEEFEINKGREVLPKNTALIISDILQKNENRIPTFGVNSPLVVPGYEVAVKTGTTNNNKDAWTIGYTPSISVGVWAGNNDNKPMKKGGSAVAGPIWNRFIKEALKVLPSENFERPNLEVDPTKVKPILRGIWQGNETFIKDKISGGLATEFTPVETKQEVAITNVHTILYWVNKNDILGPSPSNPSDDSQFEHWEIPVQSWWEKNKYKYGVTTEANIPTWSDSIHTNTSVSNISVVEPNSTDTYLADKIIYLKVNNTGPYPLKKIDVFINDVFLGTANYPFTFPFVPSELDNLRNENQIKVISYDTVSNRSEAYTIFRVE